MPTTHPRLNVSFLPETAALLTSLAKREGKTASGLARELILDALERREDIALSHLAEEREREHKGKKNISHDAAWS
ncbi:MAG: hypothetical protein PHY92_10450 [Alphaproteobacteria bacterium]|nr:hypothetical protein [Alphaproteobacteria bacterium]